MKKSLVTVLTLVLFLYAAIARAQSPEQLTELELLLNKGKDKMSGQDSVRLEINSDGMLVIHSLRYGYHAGDYSKEVWYTMFRHTFIPRFLDLDNVEMDIVYGKLIYPCKNDRACVILYIDFSGESYIKNLFLNCSRDTELMHEIKQKFANLVAAMLK